MNRSRLIWAAAAGVAALSAVMVAAQGHATQSIPMAATAVVFAGVALASGKRTGGG